MSTNVNAPYTSPIEHFLGHRGNVTERLLQHSFTNIIHTIPHTPHNAPPSTFSVSSMTPALIHQPHHASTSVPSLITTSTADSLSTISTSTGKLVSQTLLDEVDGVLVQPIPPTAQPSHRCVFWFLNCPYSSCDYAEWKGHCTAHLRGNTPPSSVHCGLCEWAVTCDPGVEAWEKKLRHLHDSHFMFGHRLEEGSRRELHLYEWLWRKRLIGDEDLKALKSGNPIENFVETNRRGPRREGGRGGRSVGMGLQHITPGQRR